MTQATIWGVPLSDGGPVSPGDVADRMDTSLDALLSSHGGTGRPPYAVEGTIWRNETTGQVFQYDGTTDIPMGLKVGVPASATASGQPGMWAAETGFMYICIATDTWERVAIATW